MSTPDGGYRLQPLLDVRGRAEQSQRSELAAAVGDAAGRVAAVTAAEARVAGARSAVAAAVAGARVSGAAAQLVRAEQYLARRRRDLLAALAELARCVAARDAQATEVDAARAKLATARAERELIERHFARWRAVRAKAADRRED